MEPNTDYMENCVAEAETLTEMYGALPDIDNLRTGLAMVICMYPEFFIHLMPRNYYRQLNPNNTGTNRHWLRAKGYHGVMKRLGMI